MTKTRRSVFNGCTWVELRRLQTSVLFEPQKNVPFNCREEAQGFHNLAYSRWIPTRPRSPMSTRPLPLANVIMWLSLLHLCEDDLRRTEMGATQGSVTDGIVSIESKQAASFCGHS